LSKISLMDLGGDCVFALGGACERASGHLQPAGLRNGHFRSDRPGSQVTAVNVETGESRETTTNEEGLYRFNLLPRGDMRYASPRPGSPWKR